MTEKPETRNLKSISHEKTERRLWILFSLFLLSCLLTGCFKSGETERKSWEVLSAVSKEEGLEVKIGGENLLRKEKVQIKTDSIEDTKYSAKYLNDGITEEQSLRWSSENDWEDPEHWVQVKFSKKTLVGAVRIFWERQNADVYSLEISEDGQSWKEVVVRTRTPEEKTETLILENAVKTTYLRLHVKEVTKREDDGSLYYQNISLLELEVYGPIKEEFMLSSHCIGEGYQRTLKMPQVPGEYTLEFIGAKHPMLIDASGKVADTIAPAKTEIGFALNSQGVRVELPPMKITVPASEGFLDVVPEEDPGEMYDVVPMEWLPYGDTLQVNENTRVEYRYLEKGINILGDEGFELTIDGEENCIVIEGKTQTALRWGQVTYEKMLRRGEGVLPTGKMRDYPSYEVRGFGIDVARKAVSLDFLYQLAEKMSEEKMNMLMIHLNDNQIIAQSDYDGSLEGARRLYSGFRLESDIRNKSGEGITSEDYFYTKEEFAQFIRDAKEYGVEVVPEIDTPGHSLALVKVFPQLGIQQPEAADLLDVSKEETLELAKDIWGEYLLPQGEKEAVFGQCKAVHIGMDEYFGKSEEYIDYLTKVCEYVRESAPEKDIIMWGSLTGMDCDYSEVPRDIIIQLWNTQWADPQEMYEEGFRIINSQNRLLYLVPHTGYDRLDTEYLAKYWEPNVFEDEQKKWIIPAYSPRLLGACYMLWHDLTFQEGISISEEEMFARFEEPLGIIADKLWE